jgi:hypothetical protein
VADDDQLGVAVLREVARELAQVRLRGGLHVGRVEVVEQAALEGDEDPLAHALDARAGDVLLQLPGALVHLVADHGAGRAAEHRADDRAARGRAVRAPDERAGRGAGHGAGGRALLLAGVDGDARARDEGQGGEREEGGAAGEHGVHRGHRAGADGGRAGREREWHGRRRRWPAAPRYATPPAAAEFAPPRAGRAGARPARWCARPCTRRAARGARHAARPAPRDRRRGQYRG